MASYDPWNSYRRSDYRIYSKDELDSFDPTDHCSRISGIMDVQRNHDKYRKEDEKTYENSPTAEKERINNANEAISLLLKNCLNSLRPCPITQCSHNSKFKKSKPPPYPLGSKIRLNSTSSRSNFSLNYDSDASSMATEGFKSPPRRKTASRSSISDISSRPATPIDNNPFDVLQIDEKDTADPVYPSATNQNPQPETTPPKTQDPKLYPSAAKTPPPQTQQAPPPRSALSESPIIMVKCDGNPKAICNKISSLISSELHFKVVNDYIKVTAKTKNERNALIDSLRSEGIQFYAPTSPFDKPLKVVFKGIYRGIDSADVKLEIENLGFTVLEVTQMRRLKTREKLPMYLVTIPKSGNVDEIYTVKTLFSLSIEVVKYEPPARVNQCHNCQKFFHGSAVCSMKPACVKCGQDHRTSECTKPRDVDPTCVNCGGKHTANYRGCPKFPKWSRKFTISERVANKSRRDFRLVQDQNDYMETENNPPTQKRAWELPSHAPVNAAPNQTFIRAQASQNVNAQASSGLTIETLFVMFQNLAAQIADLAKSITSLLPNTSA